jgi:outer membrane lipase/esterase
MRKLIQLTISIALMGLVVFPAKATFTSFYVFGDALSATTGNAFGTNNSYGETQDYYGGRYSNGRVWVEVLAQRQGLSINYNNSFFDCGSGDLLNNVLGFSLSQQLAANALVVIWCDNADIFDAIKNGDGQNPVLWTASIATAQTDELATITTLYAKGVRTLVMPNVVDISEVPYFSQDYKGSYPQFFHAECLAYNTAFSNTLNLARAACPGLTIYEPDFNALLNNTMTNAAAYGLTNALYNGLTIDAMDNLGNNANTNGAGDNYVFWDYLDPSAKLHEIMADETEQMIAPVSISKLKLLTPMAASFYTNQMTVINVPVGLNGFVETTTNLDQKGWTWTVATNITSTSTVQSLFVNATPLPALGLGEGNGPINPGGGNSTTPPSIGTGSTSTNVPPSYWQSYRLRFPMAWTWP